MLLMSKKDAPVAQLIPRDLGAWCRELNGGRNRFKLLLCDATDAVRGLLEPNSLVCVSKAHALN